MSIDSYAAALRILGKEKLLGFNNIFIENNEWNITKGTYRYWEITPQQTWVNIVYLMNHSAAAVMGLQLTDNSQISLYTNNPQLIAYRNVKSQPSMIQFLKRIAILQINIFLSENYLIWNNIKSKSFSVHL